MKTLKKCLFMFRKGVELENLEFYKDMIENQMTYEIANSKEWQEFLSFKPN